MAIIKKFRIKSFKNNKEVVKLENISFSFGWHTNLQVTRSTSTVLHLPLRCHSKSFLRSFVCFLLWHSVCSLTFTSYCVWLYRPLKQPTCYQRKIWMFTLELLCRWACVQSVGVVILLYQSLQAVRWHAA